jgi:hypothetical protein
VHSVSCLPLLRYDDQPSLAEPWYVGRSYQPVGSVVLGVRRWIIFISLRHETWSSMYLLGYQHFVSKGNMLHATKGIVIILLYREYAAAAFKFRSLFSQSVKQPEYHS